MISLCLAALNQGPGLRKTIESAIESFGPANYEIIVVDDSSDDGSCEGLGDLAGVKVFRNELNQGCTRSRYIASTKAIGDVLMFSDTHNTYPIAGLSRLARFANNRGGIWQCKLKFEGYHNQKTIIRSGFGLRIAKGGISSHLGEKRQKGTTSRHKVICSGPWAIRTDVYWRMGGTPRLPGRWGRYEPAVGLAAMRCKVPIRSDRKYTFTHHGYGDSRPYVLPPDDRIKNAFYLHAMCLPETFDDYWHPLLTKTYGDMVEWWDGDLDEQRRDLDAASYYSEDEVLEQLFGDWESKWKVLMDR